MDCLVEESVLGLSGVLGAGQVFLRGCEFTFAVSQSQTRKVAAWLGTECLLPIDTKAKRCLRLATGLTRSMEHVGAKNTTQIQNGPMTELQGTELQGVVPPSIQMAVSVVHGGSGTVAQWSIQRDVYAPASTLHARLPSR